MSRLLKQKFNFFSRIQNNVVLPERFKGTVIEKWALYWKNLFIDYKCMVRDLVVDIQEKPFKALYITGGITAAWQLAKNNPDLTDFRDDLKRYTTQLVLVAEQCQNPSTVRHFKYVEQCFNEDRIRKVNLGIGSFLWVDEYAADCELYKAQCEYTKPGYFAILPKIVDIGLMGKWWNLYRNFHNFDVNPNNHTK